jgi:hypothetical protein
MTPPSHMAFAYLVGSMLPCKDPRVRWACVGAALMPDIPFMIQCAINKANGITVEEAIPQLEQGTWVLHSLPLAGALAFLLIQFAFTFWRSLGLKFWMAVAFELGWSCCHILMDATCHKNLVKMGDPDYLWPSLYNLSWLIGFWDYRVPGRLVPKWEEVVIFFALLFLIRFYREWDTRKYLQALPKVPIVRASAAD